jgi:hypothetical protein
LHQIYRAQSSISRMEFKGTVCRTPGQNKNRCGTRQFMCTINGYCDVVMRYNAEAEGSNPSEGVRDQRIGGYRATGLRALHQPALRLRYGHHPSASFFCCFFLFGFRCFHLQAPRAFAIYYQQTRGRRKFECLDGISQRKEIAIDNSLEETTNGGKMSSSVRPCHSKPMNRQSSGWIGM